MRKGVSIGGVTVPTFVHTGKHILSAEQRSRRSIEPAVLATWLDSRASSVAANVLTATTTTTANPFRFGGYALVATEHIIKS